MNKPNWKPKEKWQPKEALVEVVVDNPFYTRDHLPGPTNPKQIKVPKNLREGARERH